MKTLMRRRLSTNPLLIGLVVGLIFGFADLALTWLNPLEDDSAGALLRFYGPMFLIWSLVAFRAARSTGRLRSGVVAGMAVAFATFCVFVVVNFMRVNLFLDQLTGRADWQNMMMRFRASGSESLRSFVNLDYIKGTPFKIGVATAFGAAFGTLGGGLGRLMRRRVIGTS
jgi:hypothetical protein